MECLQSSPWPTLLFLGFALISAVAVRRHNDFSIKETLLAMIGLRVFERSTAINISIALALIIPLAVTYRIISNCAVL